VNKTSGLQQSQLFFP